MPKPKLKYRVITLSKNRGTCRIYYRPDTKDSRVISEVIESPCYERYTKPILKIQPGEHWLDLGAHIGCFSIYCNALGATTKAYEPEKGNYRVLEMNLTNINNESGAHQAVVTASDEKTVELLSPTHRREGHIPNTKFSTFGMASYIPLYNVKNYKFNAHFTRSCQGIKMDIEGAEHEILDEILRNPPNRSVQKMVIEYHFIKNRSLIDFNRRMNHLREIFEIVQYPAHLDRFLDEGLEEYPGYFDRLIHCLHHKG